MEKIPLMTSIITMGEKPQLLLFLGGRKKTPYTQPLLMLDCGAVAVTQ
jgi:hypothetical protein